ncbi:MAG: phenylalanine--tRNA ligase subunit beta [Candidatus Sericytochromatia bacterium]|nr:phenylalanine--tRNA ligase subunit beta [Candidatus Sericytochromatia bacterium]
MRIPLSWLNELLSAPLAPEAVRDTLLRVGLEVESLEHTAPGLETVVVGQIVAIERHPNADKLRVCQTDVGEGTPLQIVTGATNVELHDLIPVARVGSNLPGDKRIEAAKLRGVESFGMYCSLAELGLPPGEDGVLVLPPDTPIGLPIAAAMKLGEPVLELAITANRPDLLCVEGVARELAVGTPGISFNRPEMPLMAQGPAAGITLGTVDADRCPIYRGLTLRGVKVGPSPEWLVERLVSCGLRSINNVVDATNYVMLLTGQPTHAFDAGRIAGGQLTVRPAASGETLETLDGVKRQLVAEDLVIADAERALVVAGVMGGRDAEVGEQTTDVFLECACFEPSGVRRTARRLGLSTDSSYRFERGTDPDGTTRALALLVDLVMKVAGGTPDGGPVEAQAAGFPQPRTFAFHLDAIERLLGLAVPNPEVERILKGLGFLLARHTDGVFELNSYDVVAPGWRWHDTTREVDLVEEVARHWGYDRIPCVLPEAQPRPVQPPSVALERRARAIATALGLTEVMTRSLTTAEAEALAGVKGTDHVLLSDPLKEMAAMRTSLLPSLLEVLRYNRYQGCSQLGVFELGRTYHRQADGSHRERRWLGAALMGSLWSGLWLPEHVPAPLAADFAYAKGLLEAVVQRLEVEGAVTLVPADDVAGLHPGRTARVHIGGREVGVLGELHPRVAQDYDLPAGQPAAAFLLDLDALAEQPAPPRRFRMFSRQPAMLRDLAVVVPATLSAQEALTAIREVGGALLERITMFDRYAGPGIPDGHVSLGFSLAYRSADRTLTTADVDPVHQAIVDRLHTSFGAVLRA